MSKDIHDAVAEIEQRESTEYRTGWMECSAEQDENGMPITPKAYPKYSCEFCGTTFEREYDVSLSGTYPRVRYCSDDCKAGAAKSRKSEEQRQINEYLKNNPVRNW